MVPSLSDQNLSSKTNFDNSEVVEKTVEKPKMEESIWKLKANMLEKVNDYLKNSHK